jgi:DNA-3-methyladenine glycosylase II
MPERFEIDPVGPYALASSARFLEGFAPAAYDGDGRDGLRFAFVADGLADGDAVAGVRVRQEGETVVGDIYGTADPEIVRRQVARILSLDVDGSGFPGVGERDPVVAALQRRYPGLRPVCFYTPYEAAAWAIISHRVRMSQAAGTKARMAVGLGPKVDLGNGIEHAFPGPSRLAGLEQFPGLTETKAERLRHLARTAVGGGLEADVLRSLPVEEAISRLRELPGIGPFSAELILLRGAGEPDQLPTTEPRLARAVARAYGLEKAPDAEQLRTVGEKWCPYRTWVALHLRVTLEEEASENSQAGGVRKDRQPEPHA